MLLIEGEQDNRPVRPFIERCVLTKQENALLRNANTKLILKQQELFEEITVLKNTIRSFRRDF